MKYSTLIKKTEKKLEGKGLNPYVAKTLLLFLSNKTSTEMFNDIHTECPKEVEDKFYLLLDEYITKNRPIEYIIGHTYFYGYKIFVDEDVLIPRWETEELAEHILIYYDRIFKPNKVNVLDLGTGSGAIAIALKKEEPNMNVYASDISKGAIIKASKSAKENDADITFLTGSWFDAIKDDTKFDIIVSNPPYLMNSEYVQDIVKDNEPHIALYGGDDGLIFYREILSKARNYLNKDKFIIAFEHGYDKKEELNKIIRQYFKEEKIVNLKDSNNLDRMTFIIKE